MTASQQPPPTAAPSTGRNRSTTILAIVAVLALAAAAFAAFSLIGGDEADASQVTLRSFAEPGPDPFTPSVAPPPSARLADYAEKGPPAGAGLPTDPAGGYQSVDGSVPGVFGGTLNELACDRDQLQTFLSAEPQKAAAWASAVAIDPTDVDAYIATLTAANLSADTRVLDHGFADGNLVPRETVLQRGTAVLVDQRGVPRVNCYSGNPLGDPTVVADETFVGSRWSSFTLGSTLVIEPAPTETQAFAMLDFDKGELFSRPAGSLGTTDSAAGTDTAPAPTEIEDTDEPGDPTPAPTPTAPAVTRVMPDAGQVPTGERISAEITPDAPALIYQVDVPAGSSLRLTVENDRASISRVAAEVRFAGEDFTFFRTTPNATEVYEVILDDTRSGLFDIEFTEGPAAFSFLVETISQNDALSGADAPADFGGAVPIESGEQVIGLLGDRDTADRYTMAVSGAPSLEVEWVVPRDTDRTAFGIEFVGDSFEFKRVNGGATDTFSLLLGPDDDDFLEFVVTEGRGPYEFTATLVEQSDANIAGDASNELVDARMLDGDLTDLRGEVGQRDVGDLYLFEAPAEQVAIEVSVDPTARGRVGVGVIGPQGNNITFQRVNPGTTGTIEFEAEAGETYRLQFSEGRGVYVFSIG